MKLTKELLEDVMVTALEGGIGYWACLLNDTPEWEEYYEKFPDEPTSVIASYMLWDGKTISFEHDYNEAVCSINLKDLEKEKNNEKIFEDYFMPRWCGNNGFM